MLSLLQTLLFRRSCAKKVFFLVCYVTRFLFRKMSNFIHPHFLVIVLLSLTAFSNSLPATTSLEAVKKDIQSPANESAWSYYKTAALTAAIIVVSVGLAGVTALLFPVFVYKICYALGGCQDTLDKYVDRMIGVEGTTRKINRRNSEGYSTTAFSNSLPATTSLEAVKKDIQSPANESAWSYYKTAALTAAIIVVSVGLAGVTALLFPVFVYKICYALGGCQDTLDKYVDRMIGVEGTTRKINRRSLNNEGPILTALAQAEHKYGSKRKIRSTEGYAPPPTAIDYFEPILETLSKGYDQYLDEDTKKNFRKRLFIR